jgi:hypothetical protein
LHSGEGCLCMFFCWGALLDLHAERLTYCAAHLEHHLRSGLVPPGLHWIEVSCCCRLELSLFNTKRRRARGNCPLCTHSGIANGVARTAFVATIHALLVCSNVATFHALLSKACVKQQQGAAFSKLLL